MILRNIRPRRDVDAADLSDITDAARSGSAYWSDEEPDALVIPLDREPTEAQARKIRRRLVTADADDEAHLGELVAAHADPQAPAWARLALAAQIADYGEPSDF